MTSTALEYGNVATIPQTSDVLIRRRINSAIEYRKQFEPQWLMALAYVAGQQWITWDRQTRQLRDIREIDDRYDDVDLYVADIIHENRGAALGELQLDSDRPELLLPGSGDEDAQSEDIARAANRVLGYAWDTEIYGDKKLRLARQHCVDLGVAPIRCRFDPSLGQPVRSSDGEQVQAPYDPGTGSLIVNPDDAVKHVADMAGRGQTARFDPVNEGRICWDTGTAFNILAPPGVPHESAFPWEIWVAPVLLAELQDRYPAAKGLEPDTDIGSTMGVSVTRIGAGQPVNTPRVADSVWTYTYYERPSSRFPKGRVAVLAGAQRRLLQIVEQLPYQRSNGDWFSGIVYLHWQRLTDRFYSRSLIDALKDPQRMNNRVATQAQEIIDRDMPYTLVEEDSLVQKPSGRPMEFVELKKGGTAPVGVQGHGPGDWMYKQRDQILSDAQHASTLSALRLGDNPQNVGTYSQLALIQEQEAAKRSSIRADHQDQRAALAELTLLDIRRYWRPGKKLVVQGEQNRVQAVEFDLSMVPDSCVVSVAKGESKPRGQAAQIQLVSDMFAAAERIGLTGLDPHRWLRWLHESYDAGETLPFPAPESDAQDKVAEFENFLMLDQGDDPVPSEYDLNPVHIPIHRKAQDKARAAGDTVGYMRIQRHIDLSIQTATIARKAFRFVDPADVTDTASDLALDEDQALRENQMMVAGEPLNPEAMQEAREALAQGQNPETGQPLAPGDDPALILLHAALKPTLTENLPVHLDRHDKVIKSAAFETFPPDVRERFLNHSDQTRTLLLSIPMMPAEVTAPKVSVSLRESVGPSTIADILRHAGVPDASAQEIASEPAQENLVSRKDPAAPAAGEPERFPPQPPL